MNFFKFFDRNLMDWVTDKELKDMFDIDNPSNIRDIITSMDTGSTINRRKLRKVVSETISTIKYPISDTTERGSYSTVYMNTSYNKKKSVVKVGELEGSTIDQYNQLCSLFFEAIITKIMFKISKEIPCFQSPDIFKCGKSYGKTVIIMEQLDAVPFSRVNEPVKAIKSLANTLRILQDVVYFSHRDLHANNCMWNGNVCIIDYGFACISMPPYNEMSVQDLFEYYSPKLEDNIYKNNMSTSLKACENKSHDLCMIILSMNNILVNDKLNEWAKEISIGYMKEIREGYNKYTISRMIYDNKYRKGMREYFFPDVPNVIDYTYYFLRKPSGVKFESIMPYQWIYDMYEIELQDFIPRVFLKDYELKACLKF